MTHLGKVPDTRQEFTCRVSGAFLYDVKVGRKSLLQ